MAKEQSILNNLDNVFQEASERINTVTVEKLDKLKRDTKNKLGNLNYDTRNELEYAAHKTFEAKIRRELEAEKQANIAKAAKTYPTLKNKK